MNSATNVSLQHSHRGLCGCTFTVKVPSVTFSFRSILGCVIHECLFLSTMLFWSPISIWNPCHSYNTLTKSTGGTWHKFILIHRPAWWASCIFLCMSHFCIWACQIENIQVITINIWGFNRKNIFKYFQKYITIILLSPDHAAFCRLFLLSPLLTTLIIMFTQVKSSLMVLLHFSFEFRCQMKPQYP